MKKLKKVLKVILFFLIIIVIGIFVFIQTLKPSYSGEKQLQQLSEEVNVYYDDYGIPHIYGENEKDAFRALGYVHAQDRLWQMELLRRIGKGGLSEVFGSDLLETDKFFISLGIDENSRKAANSIDIHSKEAQLSLAYLNGINQFIKEGPTPVEFYLTGIEKEKFTLKDVYNTMGYMAFSFAMAHKTDPLLTNLKDKLGVVYLEDLGLKIDTSTVLIKNHKSNQVQNTITAMVSTALTKTDIPLFEGSNSWVLAPEKTKNGKVIFANDPHIGFSQPCVWYEAHVVTPNYEKYGYHLAGVPFPILGHDRNLAYGMTMFLNDDVDFYYEEEHPTDNTRYKHLDNWKTYEVISKTIKVKDSSDVSFTYKKSNKGPVLNGIAKQITSEHPITMSWVYTEGDNKVMQGLYGLSHAGNIEEFQSTLPYIHAPGLNIMYGDAKGNIGWWATARLHEVPDSVNTKLIFESNATFNHKKTLPFSENPGAINPHWNYVYSANNQPDSISGILYPGYYLPENRAKRIVDLLEPKNDWDKQEVSEMIIDITSSVNPMIMHDFILAVENIDLTKDELRVLEVLGKWSGEYTLESNEATIFHRWEYYFIKNTFEDEMGAKLFDDFLSTHLSKRVIAPMAAKDTSVWWDNIQTHKRETKKIVVTKAFKEAIASLKKDLGNDSSSWTWNKVHTLEHPHPIGQVPALRSFFNVGPFAVNGSREIINNMGFNYTGDGFYKVTIGPSTRRVIDFSDIENSMSILPTGQSGNPFSPHYKDQSKMYVNGEFRKMMMNVNEIKKKSKYLLTFSAED